MAGKLTTLRYCIRKLDKSYGDLVWVFRVGATNGFLMKIWTSESFVNNYDSRESQTISMTFSYIFITTCTFLKWKFAFFPKIKSDKAWL